MGRHWEYRDEWFEETNIAKKIGTYLKSKGYEITRFSEDKKQKGHDIEATKNNRKIIVEVKGYPSDKYVDGKNKGKKKPTNPKMQARHWFAEALLSLLLAKGEDPNSQIVIGLPAFKTYTTRIERLDYLFKELAIGIVLVAEDNSVDSKGI